MDKQIKIMESRIKKLVLFIFTIACVAVTKAQDSIYLVSNKVIPAKITYINPDDIEYKKPNNFDGPSYREKKSNILRIRYSNGDIEFYEETENFGSGRTSGSLAVEHGEKATIVLLSDKVINCEIMDISDLCVVYKEKPEDENALVVMKSAVDKIWKADSSFSTFAKDGQEYRHPKPIPKAAPLKEDEPAAKTDDKKNQPADKAPAETKPKEEVTKTSSSGDKKDNKGNCQLITAEGDFIDGKNIQVNYTKKTVTYIDQFGKILTLTFKEVVVIKCPPNFISENLNEQ
jgi:hypothetical protein